MRLLLLLLISMFTIFGSFAQSVEYDMCFPSSCGCLPNDVLQYDLCSAINPMDRGRGSYYCKFFAETKIPYTYI